jgi:hypothetical protein
MRSRRSAKKMRRAVHRILVVIKISAVLFLFLRHRPDAYYVAQVGHGGVKRLVI